MSSNLDPLILDLVEWCANESRAVGEVLEAWRTSCPRLTVWEDACDRGFLNRQRGEDGVARVAVTFEGMQFLAAHGRLAAHAASAKLGTKYL
jgi:hypothetical protein